MRAYSCRVLVLRRQSLYLPGSAPPPLVAGAPPQGPGEQLIPLIGEERLDILHESRRERLSFSSTPTTRSTQLTGRRVEWAKELPIITA